MLHAETDIRRLMSGVRIKTDAEIDEIERQDRAEQARHVALSLPTILRTPKPSEVLARVKHGGLRSAALKWQPAQGNLIFSGATDIGKSAAAGYVFRRLLGRGVHFAGEAWELARRMAWVDSTELERARREHPLGRGDAPEMLAAKFASVLFVQDAGWERDPSALSDVLTFRYDSGSPTAITTALDTGAMIARYGDAVVRRMTESGGPKVVLVDATGEKT